MTDWYALRVVCRQEAFVQRALADAHLLAYVPQHVTEARFAKRKASRSRPLIPGYVFALLIDDDAMQAALAIRGVIRDGRSIPVPTLAIGSLALLEACHAFDETWTPPKPKGRRYTRRWKAGEVAMMDRGTPYEGHAVTILRAKNRNRLDVVLQIFGREVEVEVREHQLVAMPCAA